MSPSLLALGALLVFGLLELTQRKGRSARSLRTSAADRGSTLLIVFSYVVVALSLGLRPGDPWIGPVFQWSFAGIAWAGAILRLVVMRTLGAYYTRTLKVEPGQSLITIGPYRYIRHPGYLSSLMIWGGAAAASGSLLGTVIALAALLIVYVYRIRVEERMLLATMGEVYAQYRQRSWRLIPLVY